MATTTAGVYLLAPEHADAIQRLASDPDIAAAIGAPYPYPPAEYSSSSPRHMLAC
jgi:hypothetical protein